jgi:hypothetical protein
MTGKPFTNTATMREKADVLRIDRRNATMHGRAMTELDQLMQGRFAKPTEVTAAEAAPVYPAAADWTRARVPDEPPLGLDVSAVEPVGEPFEIERSHAMSQLPSTAGRDESASVAASSDRRQRPMAGASSPVLERPQPSQQPPTVYRRPVHEHS